MNLFGRAIKAVTRRKSKTVILFLIFFAIANLIFSGFAILNATNEAGNLARKKLGATITLSYDMNKAREELRSQMSSNASTNGSSTSSSTDRQKFTIKSEPVTLDMAEKIKKLPHVSKMNVVVNTAAMASGFDIVKESATADNTNNPNQNTKNSNFTLPDVTVTGVSSISDAASFQNGDAKVLSTQALPTDSTAKGVYVETTLATLNNFKLGDKIKITPVGSTEATEFTIVGIYQQDTTGEGGFRSDYSRPANTLYVDYQVALDFKKAAISSTSTMTRGFSMNDGIDKVTYIVDDPKNVNEVLKEAKKADIDWTKFILDANNSQYDAMMKPIDNVTSFAKIAVVVVSIAGAIILALILTLWVKERIYETGVLLSMGEGKLKIISQYLCEVLLIAIISFGISIGSGLFISKGVSNVLITNENKTVNSQQESTSNQFQRGNGFGNLRNNANNNTKVDTIKASEVHVNLTMDVVLELYGVGILIILLATILPASSVMRMNPKTILSKAN